MARKTAVVEIVEDNRDKGKRFLITEMAAAATERWSMRALLALGKANVAFPDDLASLGLMGLAQFGLQAFVGMDPDAAEPLMDQLMGCVEILPDPTHPTMKRALLPDDIEEISTRIRLKGEVFKLHVDFSKAASGLTSVLAALQTSSSTSTSTSQDRSGSSSPPGSQP